MQARDKFQRKTASQRHSHEIVPVFIEHILNLGAFWDQFESPMQHPGNFILQITANYSISSSQTEVYFYAHKARTKLVQNQATASSAKTFYATEKFIKLIRVLVVCSPKEAQVSTEKMVFSLLVLKTRNACAFKLCLILIRLILWKKF